MANIINALLRFDHGTTIRVGQLAEEGHRLYFQYDQELLNKNLWLSPYKLPLKPDLCEHKEMDFGPLFGLFADSLPDAWGMLLMDRFLRKRGYNPDTLSVLDRLAFLGESTMGALVYQPALALKEADSSPFDLHNLSVHARDHLSGSTDEVLPQLMNAGGSPGGARPKVLAGVSGDKIVTGETDLAEPFEHWIIKFAAANDLPDAGPVEYAYSLMARAAGLQMTATRLFKTPEGDRFFGIKRFDRTADQRLHVHTFGNLIHSNFLIPSQDYDHLFKIVMNLTRNHQDLVRVFAQMVFNILANNRDDHVKNFAFIMDRQGEWSLSPAYDLIYAPGPGGEHSLTVLGEGQAPSRTEVFKLGEMHGIKKKTISQVVESVSEAVNDFKKYADVAGVSRATFKKINAKIQRHLATISRADARALRR